MAPRRKDKKKSHDITLCIEKLGAGGDGVGTYNNKPVFIIKALPGDVVNARVEEFRDCYRGFILQLVKKSPDRIAPDCKHYDHCGGCSLQHLKLEEYKKWKISKVEKILHQSDITTKLWLPPIFISRATRRRTSLAILRTSDKFLYGYHHTRSHNITSIEQCLILNPKLDEKIQSLRPYIYELAPLRTALDLTIQYAQGSFDLLLTGEWYKGSYFSLEQNEILSQLTNVLGIGRICYRKKEHSAIEIVLSNSPITKTFGALDVVLPPGAFLQASDKAEEALTKLVIEQTLDAKYLADLFCGSGTFSGHLLQRGARVHAVDGDIHAIRAMKHPMLTTQHRNLFKDPLNDFELKDFDAVILDPPRAGASEQCSIIANSDIPLVCSVSCNPVTFAQDAQLLQAGGYSLQTLCLVDQFVWSAHTELVGIFQRNR